MLEPRSRQFSIWGIHQHSLGNLAGSRSPYCTFKNACERWHHGQCVAHRKKDEDVGGFKGITVCQWFHDWFFLNGSTADDLVELTGFEFTCPWKVESWEASNSCECQARTSWNQEEPCGAEAWVHVMGWKTVPGSRAVLQATIPSAEAASVLDWTQLLEVPTWNLHHSYYWVGNDCITSRPFMVLWDIWYIIMHTPQATYRLFTTWSQANKSLKIHRTWMEWLAWIVGWTYHRGGSPMAWMRTGGTTILLRKSRYFVILIPWLSPQSNKIPIFNGLKSHIHIIFPWCITVVQGLEQNRATAAAALHSSPPVLQAGHCWHCWHRNVQWSIPILWVVHGRWHDYE